MNRLTGATGRYGTIGYTYNDAGNRLTRDTNGAVESYSYVTGTNRLQEVTGGQTPRSFVYDDNGNITTDGTRTFIYDRNNRLVGVEEGTNTVASYTYNGLGQRVKKVAGGTTTLYHYDMDGKLIAEGLPDGTITREYLYMGKVRLAMVDVASGKMYQIHNDRLGTPELMTDDTGTVVWEAWYEPFGKAHVHPSSSVANNLRFPGQMYDAETGLHYNYHRYYDPTTGRYLTPDPIGLAGGINLYVYVGNNPVNEIDLYGLYLTGKQQIIVSIAGGAGAIIGGVAVGFTSWGIGAPLGAAVGTALFGAATASLLGGDLADIGTIALTGLAAGYLGAEIGSVMSAISLTGIQAAIRTGLLTGGLNLLLIGPKPAFGSEGITQSSCKP